MLIQLRDEDLFICRLSPLSMLDLASSSSKFYNAGLIDWSMDLVELITEIHLMETQKLSFCGCDQGF